MILILDNAPYHHARSIPVLTSTSKCKLLDIMEPLVTVLPDAPLLLPLTTADLKRVQYTTTFSKEDHHQLIVEYYGEKYFAIPLNKVDLSKRETTSPSQPLTNLSLLSYADHFVDVISTATRAEENPPNLGNDALLHTPP